MSHQADPTATDATEQALRAELKRYGNELAADAIEPLIDLWVPRLRGCPGDRIAEAVAEWLEWPEIAVWAKNYKRSSPMEAQCPLRTVLRRHASELIPGAIEVLAREWGQALNALTPAQIAGEVCRRLAGPDNAVYRRVAGAALTPRQTVLAVLARFTGDLAPGAVVDLHRIWVAELSCLPSAPSITEAVFQRLASPTFANYWKPGRSLPRTGAEALRDALARRGDLRPRAAEILYRIWAPLLGHLPPARVAGLVEERLASASYQEYLTVN
jgi:hypothetical protein